VPETDVLGVVFKLAFLAMFALSLYFFLDENERISLGLMRNKILFGR